MFLMFDNFIGVYGSAAALSKLGDQRKDAQLKSEIFFDQGKLLKKNWKILHPLRLT